MWHSSRSIWAHCSFPLDLAMFVEWMSSPQRSNINWLHSAVCVVAYTHLSRQLPLFFCCLFFVLFFAKCATLSLPQGSSHLVICDSEELSMPATPYLSTRCHKSWSADSHVRDIPRPAHIPKSFFSANTPASHDLICPWSEYTKVTSPYLWTIFHLVNMYSCFSNLHLCQIFCLLPALPPLDLFVSLDCFLMPDCEPVHLV